MYTTIKRRSQDFNSNKSDSRKNAEFLSPASSKMPLRSRQNLKFDKIQALLTSQTFQDTENRNQDSQQATIDDRKPIMNIHSSEKKMHMIEEDGETQNEIDESPEAYITITEQDDIDQAQKFSKNFQTKKHSFK